MKILITGAAGYIGSVVTEELVHRGVSVVAIDNLSKGHRLAVAPEALFIKGDIGDTQQLEEVFSSHAIEGVVHLAAESLVEMSVKDPGRYFKTNVTYPINLLEVMLKNGVKNIIFSSSAAVYGDPVKTPIEESDRVVPVNAYGESKLMFERILRWFGIAHGLKHISLRYFNAAGASVKFGEDHHPETHLIPNIIKVALGEATVVNLFGTDYDTRDGTCVRDYIHVKDIAAAHILALEHLDSVNSSSYNLGNGDGFTVKEVIKATETITGDNIPVNICPRRQGDPAVLQASSNKITRELGWKPKYPRLDEIIRSAWDWHRQHPRGYGN